MTKLHPLRIAFGALILVFGCAAPPLEVDEPDRARRAVSAAYLSYRDGDCEGVAARARDAAVDLWPTSEERASFQLLTGFCEERFDDVDAARETYRRLVAQAPLTFAALDARDRLRTLRLFERDPDHAAWVEDARKRARTPQSDRAPINRVSAQFPPHQSAPT